MAGTSDLWPAGSGDEFRADIREVIEMAMPNATQRRPTFKFDQHRVFAEADDVGQPFDYHSDPASSSPKADVQVLCTIEPMTPGAVDDTAIGAFAGDRARLYFFETEWAQVHDFTELSYDGIDYKRVRRRPSPSLFDVDIYCVEVVALDA